MWTRLLTVTKRNIEVSEILERLLSEKDADPILACIRATTYTLDRSRWYIYREKNVWC